MTITKRLFSIFALLALAMCVLAGASLYAINGFQARFEYVQLNAIPSIKDLDKTISTTSQLNMALYEHQSEVDNARQNKSEQKIGTLIADLITQMNYYLEHDISSDEDRAMTRGALSDIVAIQGALPAFIAASLAHNDALTLPMMQGDAGIGAAVRKVTQDLNTQIELNIQIGENLRKENSAIYTRVFWGLLSFSIVVILLMGALACKTILGVRRSLNDIQQVMEETSESLDLTRQADDSRQDEMGKTAVAFNALMLRIASAMSAVTASAQSVSSASTQIAAGNEDLSARTEEQAASLEQTSASMSTLNDTVKQSAENARQASLLASNANEMAEQSGNAVSAMANTMDNIKASSGKISDITGLIEGIAFQTNILALNAAVEAARAGEQGRGFAVVASEVRNLAQRSSTAAKEIKDLIVTSAQLVQSGAIQVVNVGENMAKVQGSIRQVADIVGEMAAATSEQSRGIEQVHLAVGQMDSVTQQNAALVEQASAASQSLQEQATILSNLVGAFKVQTGSVAPAVKLTTPVKLAGKPAAHKAELATDNWSSF